MPRQQLTCSPIPDSFSCSRAMVDAIQVGAGASPLATLPLALAQQVFLLLDVQERARAACVCRSWRDVLADPALWSRLVFSHYMGCEPASDRLLLGASARAGGKLSFLDVSRPMTSFTPQVLLSVLAAHADHLRELRVPPLNATPRSRTNPSVEELLRAVPLLDVLDASHLECDVQQALTWLRAGPIRCRSLKVHFQDTTSLRAWRVGRPCSAERVREFTTLLDNAAVLPGLTELTIHGADTSNADVLLAIVDLALSRGLPRLHFQLCTPPAAVPFARLLAGGAVKQLSWRQTMVIGQSGRLTSSRVLQFLDGVGAALVADALRANTTLVSVEFSHASLCCHFDAAATVLGGLIGHPSLNRLHMYFDPAVDSAALGAVLAAIVAADSPALEVLRVVSCSLRDTGLAPIVDALPRNHHLRDLDLRSNDMGDDFARLRLVPALRENTGLRQLYVKDGRWEPSAAGAEAMITARNRKPPRS